MSTPSTQPSSSSPAAGLSNPIPLAAVATSHVDQLGSHSPPQPPLAFSPSDHFNPSSPPPAPSLSLDTATEPLVQHKQHPADLVSVQNPDPHPSPSASPTESTTDHDHPHSFSQAFDDDSQSAASFPTAEGGAHHHGRGGDVASSILSASENGVTLGHGSEEGGHGHADSPKVNGRRTSGSAFGDSQALVESDAEGEEQHEHEQEHEHEHDGEQEREGEEVGDHVEALVPLSYNANHCTATSPLPTSASSSNATPRKAHGRSQSLASPSTSRPPSTSSSPRQPPSTSASNERPSSSREGTSADREREREREREQRGERRDREREREREAATANGKEKERRSGEKEREKESTRSRRVLGEWTMSKTLGAGSMGKVKLGISGITGEKVAIKIIPRFTSTAAANRPPPKPSSKDGAAPTSSEEKEYKPPTASFLAKAAAKDQSKEVRTMREGSLSLLLHHPYVCGMKSMMLYPNHYYMIFEYVNGGQMLDYIISHGRLRERSARKFARQIGSALEYCHANSIVHRDLKIENILISKTGNIKIIDFGLSNLYSPTSHLSTFCGSLYFAAPELLNAKPYTGPEVDVWSFGIVLYVLVCGKVPFDDQSMPALHAKIKRGQVEYPGWLSAECKHLLSRMLVTTPSSRATLTEVLSHPWIVKGFSGPPASHLPPRSPLRADDLDREIIKGMVGFELGSNDEIYDKLRDVLSSDGYRQAVRMWEGRKAAGLGSLGEKEEGRESDKERPATRVDGKDMKGLGRSPTNKRFSGLGFYGKKLAGGFNAAFSAGGSGGGRSSDDSDGGGGGPLHGHHGVGGGRVESLDPTRGFDPLISLYFLVKEKVEREKIWGPGVFASSTLSLNGPPPPPAPAMAYQAGSGPVPVAPPSTVSGIKPPPSALSATAPSDVSAPPVASPLIPMTPQPRQRATGEEYPQHPSTAPQGSRGGDDYRFASNSVSKRSSFHPASSAPNTPVLASQFTQRPRSSYEPASPTPQRTSHIIDRTGSGVGSHSQQDPSSSLATPDDIPLSSSPSGFARRFGSLLGRSSSTNADFKPGHRQRASIAGTSHRASTKTPASALPQVTETSIRASGSDVPLPSPPEGKAVHRSSTVGELSPNRHQRGVSMGAESLGRATVGAGTAGERRRMVSMSSSSRPRTSGDVQNMFDEVEEELTDSAAAAAAPSTTQDGHHQDEPPHHLQQDVGFVGRTASASGSGSEQAKPVWLKGLFSVTTTSTKPAATIRADLIRVLDRLGVQHRDVKSGFECAHVPSIDLSSVGAGKKDQGGKGTIRRRASNLLLSSGGSRKDKDSATANADDSSTSLGNGQGGGPTHAASSTSFDPMSPTFDTSSQAQVSPNQNQTARFNSSTAEGSSVSSELIVRFEIFIVRMPLLPGISGLQFRRIGGNAWQYQMLARRVLAELKL